MTIRTTQFNLMTMSRSNLKRTSDRKSDRYLPQSVPRRKYTQGFLEVRATSVDNIRRDNSRLPRDSAKSESYVTGEAVMT